MFRSLRLTLILYLVPLVVCAQHYNFKPIAQGVKSSFRGLCLVNDQIIWVSGSNGFVGKSLDAGKTWQWMQPKGYEKLDFRDIQAFDENRAIIVNAGSPAYILSTTNGGKTWSEHYKNTDSAIFLDGLDFWDAQNGIIFGDPIEKKLQLLKTSDAGVTWQNISSNFNFTMAIGEAGFAASGTTIKALGEGKVWIATGGAESNVYYSSNYGNTWKKFKCPIQQGESSTGVFSIDFFDAKRGIAVGGNYLKDTDATNNVLYTTNGGKKWRKPRKGVSGYRSGVVYVNSSIGVATGTSGTDISLDGGRSWTNISSLGFNAVKANHQFVVLAGGRGEIYQLEILP
jgi:photosystem II stability/assembly factor-like uncharacterized protein